MKRIDLSNDVLNLGAFGGRVFVGSGLLGMVILAIAYGISGSGSQAGFMKSWLFAFLVVAAISLGALFFVILQHLVKAGWSVTVRRIAEGMAANLSWLWLLFLPIAWYVYSGQGGALFPWADAATVEHDHLLHKKAGYLNPGFWLIRAAFFFLVWGLVSRFYFSLSKRQDAHGDVSYTNRMQRCAPIAMILYALTQTFASFDWIMSLQPKWFSTMFGVYFFVVSLTGFFSSIIVLIWFLQRSGRAVQGITREHVHDLGKLLFAFGVVFWAYIAYSQYMLIWYANLPIETSWFFPRHLGPWYWVSIILIWGHFLLPFVLLISRWTKRWQGPMVLMAAWMICIFIIDMYWLVMPVVPEEALAAASSYDQLAADVDSGAVSIGWSLNAVDFMLPFGMLCLLLSGTMFNLRKCTLVPVADPRLDESLAFENF